MVSTTSAWCCRRNTRTAARMPTRISAPRRRSFSRHMPSMDAVHKYFKETGQWPENAEDFATIETEAWPERRVFQVILEKFGLLPITSDSHFGEYIQWAYDVTDHKGILDFYRFYKEFLANVQPKIELRLSERIIPIIEGILTDSGYCGRGGQHPQRGPDRRLARLDRGRSAGHGRQGRRPRHPAWASCPVVLPGC